MAARAAAPDPARALGEPGGSGGREPASGSGRCHRPGLSSVDVELERGCALGARAGDGAVDHRRVGRDVLECAGVSIPRRYGGRGMAEIRELTIEKLVYGGDGLARIPSSDGRQQAVFVPFVLPGEVVRVELEPPARGRTTARVIEIL